MKAKEFIIEYKKDSKPRNFVAKNAKMGGAGQHKDKKKAEKQGDVKHKNKQVAEGALNEGKGLTGELAGFLKSNGFKGPYRLGKLPKWAAELSEFGKDDLIMVQGNDVEYDEFVVDIGYGILYWGAEDGMTKMTEKAIMNHVQQGVAEAFGPLPRDNQTIRLGKYTVDIERVGEHNDYFGFAWHDSRGREHYEEVSVGDLGSYDDLIARIKSEIQYQERRYTDQGVAEGTPGNDFRVGQQVIYTTGRGEKFPSIVTAVDFDEDAVKIKSANNKPFPNNGGDIEIVVDPGWKFLTVEPRVDPDSIIAVSPNMRKTTERVRDPEDWDEGNTEPPNNFAVYINGKKWKVFQGRGQYADDAREKAHYQQLKTWAQQKSAQSGKKWEVYITGEAPTA